MNTPINPASLKPGTWLIRDAGTDHETRVQFVSREPARGRKPALSRLFSAEWIMPGFDGHAIAYDEDLIEFYQLESEVVRQPRQRSESDILKDECDEIMRRHQEEKAATVEIVTAEAFLDLVSLAAPEAQSVIVVPLQVSELPGNFSDYLQCLLSPTVLHIRSGHPIQGVPPLAPSLGSASIRIRPLGSPSRVVDCEDNNQ